MSLFLLLTGLAWGLAYADGFSRTIRVALVFVLGHFLAVSLLIATAMFFLVGRVLGKRRQGLFGPPVGGEEGLEFGYCFDVRFDLSTNVGFPGSFADTLSGCDTSIPTRLGLPLRATVHPHAAHRAGLLGLKPIREHDVPLGIELLLRDYIPGLQW